MRQKGAEGKLVTQRRAFLGILIAVFTPIAIAGPRGSHCVGGSGPGCKGGHYEGGASKHKSATRRKSREKTNELPVPEKNQTVPGRQNQLQ